MVHDIQIVRCPREEAELFCTRVSSRHVLFPLPSWEWCRWLQRQAPSRSRLCVVHDLETDQNVISVWVYGPEETTAPLLHQLHAFSGPMDKLWPPGLPHPEIMKRILQPGRVGVAQKRYADKLASEREARATDLLHRNEVVSHLRRNDNHELASAFDSGTIPFAGAGSASRENEIIASELSGMLKKGT